MRSGFTHKRRNKMSLKEQFIKADIEDLEKRKRKLLNRMKLMEVTLKGINFKINNKERLIR